MGIIAISIGGLLLIIWVLRLMSRADRVNRQRVQRRVVVTQGPLLDVEFGHLVQHRDPFAAQRPAGRDVLGIRNRLMPRPDPFVIGHDAAVAERPHSVQVGDHLDSTPDHRGVHRVVVAIEADVVIASQLGRRSPPRRRGDRRLGEHRLTVRGDPFGRRASQGPALPDICHRKPLLQLTVEVQGCSKNRPLTTSHAVVGAHC
jgi:hypothetical protein